MLKEFLTAFIAAWLVSLVKPLDQVRYMEILAGCRPTNLGQASPSSL